MSLTAEESFRNSYHYFIDAVQTLACEPDATCERMGDFNVAWELQDDVQAGQILCGWELLSRNATAQIEALVQALDGLPPELLKAAQGRPGNLAALSDEAWTPVRRQASALLTLLESVNAENEVRLRGGAK